MHIKKKQISSFGQNETKNKIVLGHTDTHNLFLNQISSNVTPINADPDKLTHKNIKQNDKLHLESRKLHYF